MLNPEQSNKYAVIDVGTNNVLMLLAGKEENRITPLFRNSSISALGKNMRSGYLTETAIKRTRGILHDNIEYARLFTEKIIVIGTSCSRDAKNIGSISDWLKKKYGLPFNIISGEDEAYYNGLANISEFHEFEDFVLFDVGGGSTEFTYISSGKITKTLSLPLGIRRLQNSHGSDLAAKISKIRRLLKSIPVTPASALIGIGGTVTSISAIRQNLRVYDSGNVHKSWFNRSDLDMIISRIRLMNTTEIERLLPFDPLRADIILTGTLIIREIIDHLGGERIYVSDQGLQFGILQLENEKLEKFYRLE